MTTSPATFIHALSAARPARRALLAALLGAAIVPTPALADKLIDNVQGVTLDAEGRTVRFTGLVIDNAGKVAKLLKQGDTRPKKGLTFNYNARGKILLPGMIDAHGHVMGLGFQAMNVDLSGTTSLAEAQARIRDFAARHPNAPFIIGRGWNQEAWQLGRFPTAAELDAAESGRPVWLRRVDGHAGWANSKAIAMAGVTGETKSPAGGRIELAGGRPAGVFVDNAMTLIEARLPKPLSRDNDEALSAAQATLVRFGITTVADMGTDIDAWQAMRRAGDEGRLNVRILSYAAGIDDMALIAGPRPTGWLYQDRLKLVGVKLYMDGALGSRGAWLKADYHDAPGQRGFPLLTDTQLRNKMVRAAMDGFQIAVHAIGDRANQEMLDAIDAVAATYPGDRRWRIEHAQVVDPADIARFGKHGIIASMQPTHQTSDRLMAQARLGADRLKGAYAWQDMLKSGARVALGSDFPIESPDPWAGLAAAISRQGADGQPVGGWFPAQALTPQQALDGFTRSAAFAAFAEDRLGTLMPGRDADFIMVDTDPLTASPEQIRRTKVLETWVGGATVYVAANDKSSPAAKTSASMAAPPAGRR